MSKPVHSAAAAPAPGESQPAASTRNLAMRGIALALLVLAVAIVYAPSLHAPLVFDDHESVLTSPSIKRLWPLWTPGIGSSPLNPQNNSAVAGRPAVNVTFALNHAWGGTDPFGYHLVDLALHAVASLLVFGLVRRTLRLAYFEGEFDQAADPLGFLSALLWAVHPLQIDAVQYVSQRTEQMAALFYLAVMYGSLRYFTAAAPRQRAWWCALAGVAGALGMASKEIMASAPILVLLYDWTFNGGSVRQALARSARLYGTLAAGWVVLLLLNYNAPRAMSASFDQGVSLPAWWLLEARVLVMYLKLAVWPWPLAIHYHMPLYANPLAAWFPLAVLALLAFVLRIWKRGATGFVALWVLLILLPTLIVPMPSEAAAERRMHLPLVGIVAMLVVACYALLRDLAAGDDESGDRRPARWPLAATLAAGLAVAVAFVTLDLRRLRTFETELSLWEDTIKVQPESMVVMTNLARELLLAGRDAEATRYYEQARPQKPSTVERQWGLTLIKAGRPAEAEAHFAEAIRLQPSDEPALRRDLGMALLVAGHPAAAVPHLARAVASDRGAPEMRHFLASALIAADQPQAAVEQLRRLARLATLTPELEEQLASAQALVREKQQSIAPLRRKLAQEPASAQAHFALGDALLAVGEVDEAIAELKEALRLRPDFPAAQARFEQSRQAHER